MRTLGCCNQINVICDIPKRTNEKKKEQEEEIFEILLSRCVVQRAHRAPAPRIINRKSFVIFVSFSFASASLVIYSLLVRIGWPSCLIYAGRSMCENCTLLLSRPYAYLRHGFNYLNVDGSTVPTARQSMLTYIHVMFVSISQIAEILFYELHNVSTLSLCVSDNNRNGNQASAAAAAAVVVK